MKSLGYLVLIAILFALMAPRLAEAGQDSADGGWRDLTLAAAAALRARQYEEAYRLYTLEVRQLENLGVKDSRMAAALCGLGAVRRIRGHCGEAAVVYLRAVKILEANSTTNPAVLATAWQYLSSAYYCERRYSLAERALFESLASKQKAYGDEHPEVAEVLSSLAEVYRSENRLPDAVAACERAKLMLEKSPAQNSLSLVGVLDELGTIYHAMRRPDEAEASARRAVAILEQHPDPDGTRTVNALNNLAIICSGRRNYLEASAHLAQAVKLVQEGAIVGARETAQLLASYANCLRKIGRANEAKEFDAKARLIVNSLPRNGGGQLTVDAPDLLRGK